MNVFASAQVAAAKFVLMLAAVAGLVIIGRAHAEDVVINPSRIFWLHSPAVHVVGRTAVALFVVIVAILVFSLPASLAHAQSAEVGVEITGLAGKCLTAPANGTRVILLDCVGGDDQLWTFNLDALHRTPPEAIVILAKSKQCLGVAEANPANGTGIILSDCVGGDDQRWMLRIGAKEGEGAIVGLADPSLPAVHKCLDVEAASPANGTPVILYDCHGGPNQSWALNPPNGTIVCLAGKCLDVEGENPTNGTRIILLDCKDPRVEVCQTALPCPQRSPSQHWTVNPNGAIVGLAGKCLDVAGAKPANFTGIILYDCHGGPSQHWTVDPNGTIVGLAGKCLDVAGANTANFTGIILYDCHGGPNQRWAVIGRAALIPLATMGVVGPLYLDDCNPWTVRGVPAAGVSLPTAASTWCKGKGFDIADENSVTTIPKIFVTSDSVAFGARVTFTDATTASTFVFTGYDGRKDPKHPFGTLQAYALVYRAGFVEGNHAHYTLNIQEWKDGAVDCPSPQTGPDPDQPAVVMNAPSPSGQPGCWVAVNQPGNASDPFEPGAGIDIYGSSVQASAGIRAAKDATVSGSVTVPIQLSKVATYLRGVVTVWEGDTRTGTAAPGGYTYAGWSAGSSELATGLYDVWKIPEDGCCDLSPAYTSITLTAADSSTCRH